MAVADRNQTRILIVGAGPVGLAAAIEFSRRGYTPRIVDTASGPPPIVESRALAINVRSLDLLEPAGVTLRILAEAVQVKQMRMFAHDRRLLTVDTMEIQGRFQGMHVLPQGRTQHILLERLSQFGVTPEWNTTFQHLSGEGGRRGVVLRLPDGTSAEADIDIVVGADGAHSLVRKAAGLEFPGNALSETFYLADYRYATEVDTSFIEAHFYGPGVMGRLPVDRRTLRFVSTLSDFRDRIRHPARIEEISWQAEFRVSFRHVDPMSRDNVYLCGDAAHIHSPIGGRGMNLGFEDACWLAWLVSEGREAEYSDLRLPAVRHVLAETRRNTNMALMRNPVALAARNVLMPLLGGLPWLRRESVRSALGLDTPSPPWLA